MDINEYLKPSRLDGEDGFPMAKRIYCQDGFSLSVQANWAAYCDPRDNHGPYYKVEVGFPSAKPELIMNYAEQPDRPTQTVYGYVPVDLVEELIELHGGIASSPQPSDHEGANE